MCEDPSTSRTATILHNETAGRAIEMKTLQQERLKVKPLLQSSNFDSADKLEKMSETIKEQDQLKINTSSILETDNSFKNGGVNLQSQPADAKAVDFETLKQEFIRDTAKSVDNGTYGLPSIGGAISSKLSKDSRSYYNHNIVNNGSQHVINTFSTDDYFKLIKKAKKFNDEIFVKT